MSIVCVRWPRVMVSLMSLDVSGTDVYKVINKVGTNFE